MKQTIYEDLTTNRRYEKINGSYEEIPSEEEHLFRGCPVSHGYMHPCTADHAWKQAETELEKMTKE